MSLFLLLGLSLGTSITTFILHLNNTDKILSIISYFCLALFSLLSIVLAMVIAKYSRIMFNNQNEKEENQNEKQEEK